MRYFINKLSGSKILFLLFCLIIVVKASPQSNQYPLIRTSQNVAVNTKLPNNIISANEPITASFSERPTDEEIFNVHFFEEPLVPAKGEVSSSENLELVHALVAFSQRKNPDDFTAITQFLKDNPESRWNGALLANLGMIYRRTGYYDKALECWEQAWSLLKNQKENNIKALADRVVSELLLINSWVGRQQRMEELLNEINGRIISGPAVETVSTMKAALSIMKNRPGVSFKCGPFALNSILRTKDSTHFFNDSLMAVQSTSSGFSLTQLERLAKAVHLDYEMAFRNPGAKVILNSVVHWKLGHYSALSGFQNGWYKCKDATMGAYGQQFWLTPAALDSSASGYFLVPNAPLPKGWRKVGEAEGDTVYGKGNQFPDPGGNTAPNDSQEPVPCKSKPMAQCNVHLLAVSLHIYDQPVYYQIPLGPQMVFKLDYIQRDIAQPANFSYSNMGPKWTFNWLSYVQDNPDDASASANVYGMGGGYKTFIYFDTATQSYAPEMQTNDVLVRTCPNCYELRHPDGSKEVYGQPDGNTSSGRKIFLTKTIDAAGNTLTITYDNNLRIAALKDAIGQVTTFTYGESSDIYKITKVTDPFGRSANFEYDDLGRLDKITDMIGIVSSFQYDPSTADFINKMTTPYGSTGFISQEGNGTGMARVLETHYPLGEKERVEYLENAPDINLSDSLVPTGMSLDNFYLTFRNTFYWDKKAMKEAPGDYTKAKIYHWLHGVDALNEMGSVAPMLECLKMPLESRVWYSYQNQPSTDYAYQGMSAKPYQTGQVLDDGTTRLITCFYNALGKDTLSIDPIGRKISHKYDKNNIDLLEIREVRNNDNKLLAKFTYNAQHLPLTATDASGLKTKYTYNAAGQLLTVKNPKNETTKFTYNTNGYLQKITGPITGSTLSFTYDGYGRVRTVTDPAGYKVTTDYDALDRPTIITYPDSSFEQIVYDRLNVAHVKDRLGRWSHELCDSLGRTDAIQDAPGRITQFIWCSCGHLAEIVDPLKNVTTFVRDLQGRVISKIYDDGKAINYQYENTTSRVKQVTDSKGQTKQFSYFKDDNLKEVDYLNAQVATPSVTFIYDSIFNRINSMTDGTGITTYTYKPVNSATGSLELATVNGPLANDVISYTYDSLGRINGRSINAVASSMVYDALGRINSETNALGQFNYNYLDQTDRLSSISMPNGQSTTFKYLNTLNDDLLSEILNKGSNGAIISKFDYTYNKQDQITKWTRKLGSTAPVYYDLGYDASDELISATQKNQNTSAILKRYAYQYDKAGNRTSEQIDNTVTSSVYNTDNQLTNQLDHGPMRFKGTLSKFSSVLVKDLTSLDSAVAPVDTTNAFEAFVKTVPGTNNISVKAVDYSGNNNTTTSNYNIAITAGTNNTLAFDNNGNTTSSATPNVTYSWDAEDRLVKITIGTDITEFVYDGLGRRVAEKLNGTIIKRWLWDAATLIEERNSSGSTVTKRFFSQGEQINGVNFYFTKDHLGSIREMIAADGSTINAQYSYDAYGRRTKISGSLDADFGFTGYYYHAASGLYLSLYRAYDANIGRWLKRDPMGERAGANLYAYVNGNPVNYLDPMGLGDVGATAGLLIGAFGSANPFVALLGGMLGGNGTLNILPPDFQQQILQKWLNDYKKNLDNPPPPNPSPDPSPQKTHEMGPNPHLPPNPPPDPSPNPPCKN